MASIISHCYDYIGITIKFASSEYYSSRHSPAKPRLKLSKTPNFRVRVTIDEEDGTAIG